MPTDLFSLSDELLQRIARFTHGDTFIPLPSFHPHWLNLVHELDPHIAQDYLNLRLACKKLHTLCPLQDLHLIISKSTDLERSLTALPNTFLSSVRRLRLSMRPERADMTIAVWCSVTTCLQNLPNLEDLYIQNSAFCYHSEDGGYRHGVPTNELKIPAIDFLPSLKSLSVSVSCSRCANILPTLFVPAAPKLEHLLMASCKTKNQSADPAKALQVLSDAWTERHPGRTFDLKTLYLRIPSHEMDMFPLLRQTSVIFPALTALKISPYHDTDNLAPGPIIFANRESSAGIWAFEINDPPRGDWRSSMSKVLEDLDQFQRLETLDCVLVISLSSRPHRPAGYIPTPGENWHNYTRGQMSAKSAMDRMVKHDKIVREAIEAIVDDLVRAIPTLTSGAFWEYNKVKYTSHQQVWYRWTWWSDFDERGAKAIHVSSSPLQLGPGFVKNRGGGIYTEPDAASQAGGSPSEWDSDEDDYE